MTSSLRILIGRPSPRGDRENGPRIITHIGAPACPTGPEGDGSVFDQEREHLPCGTFTAQSAFVDGERRPRFLHLAERSRDFWSVVTIFAAGALILQLICELAWRLPG